MQKDPWFPGIQERFKVSKRRKIVKRGNKLGWRTSIKQPNPENNIKGGIAKHYPYFLSIRPQKSESLLQIIVLLSFYKRYVRCDSGTQGANLRRQKAKRLNKNIVIISSDKNIDCMSWKIRNCIRNQNFLQIKAFGYSRLVHRYMNLKKIRAT